MSADPQSLMDQAKCYVCTLGVTLAEAFELALLAQIAENGRSGSSGLAGSGSPEGVQTASPGTTYLNTTDDSFWVKKTGTGNTGWIQLIG